MDEKLNELNIDSNYIYLNKLFGSSNGFHVVNLPEYFLFFIIRVSTIKLIDPYSGKIKLKKPKKEKLPWTPKCDIMNLRQKELTITKPIYGDNEPHYMNSTFTTKDPLFFPPIINYGKNKEIDTRIEMCTFNPSKKKRNLKSLNIKYVNEKTDDCGRRFCHERTLPNWFNTAKKSII